MLTKAVFFLVCLCLVVSGIAILLLRTIWPEHLPLFTTAMLSLLLAAVLAAIAAVAAIVFVVQGKPVTLQLTLAIILGLMPLAAISLIIGERFNAPLIHDISTDWRDPPVFTFAPGDRSSKANSLALNSKTISVQQARYPEIKPLHLAAEPEQVITYLETFVMEQGWQVLGRSEKPYQIEVVVKTALMGFKDDLAIRVTPLENGAIIDARSASRVGQGDFAANALRITGVMEALARCCKSHPDGLDSPQ